MRISTAALKQQFEQLFGKRPSLYRAPGRVNLIGEHTDYNDGFVMPAAIDMYCYVAIAPRTDRHLVMHSAQFRKSTSVDIDKPRPATPGEWSDYVLGTALALEKNGHRLKGADILVSGELPLGAGLSSSAAIEVAAGYALLDLAGITVDPVPLAVACRRAENEFVGARVGIMDQFISANGAADQAILLDCRSLAFTLLPIPADVRLVVCNTGVRHEIAGGEYNERRAQCEQGVKLLSASLTGIRALRDVSATDLERYKSLLPELIYRRCRHVVTENRRAERAAIALTDGDLPELGRLMAESHRSLRDDYEVSCRELDMMVEIAAGQSGGIGARMTGGGFGGSTINLVRSSDAAVFKDSVGAEYKRRTGIHPEIYILSAASGAQLVSALESGV